MNLDRICPAVAGALFVAALALSPFALRPAHAMGEVGDATTTESAEATEGEPVEGEAAESEAPAEDTETTESPAECEPGFTLNTETNECEQSSGGLLHQLPAVGWAAADPAFVAAAVLAHSGRYQQAIEAFDALQRPDDPYVLNYLGFSNRKLGHVDAALAYYHKALSIRPDYVRAREYLGEGYIALGRINEAKEQLALIEATCGTGCDAYRKLDAAIEAVASKS